MAITPTPVIIPLIDDRIFFFWLTFFFLFFLSSFIFSSLRLFLFPPRLVHSNNLRVCPFEILFFLLSSFTFSSFLDLFADYNLRLCSSFFVLLLHSLSLFFIRPSCSLPGMFPRLTERAESMLRALNFFFFPALLVQLTLCL